MIQSESQHQTKPESSAGGPIDSQSATQDGSFDPARDSSILIIGAGPAGLTAAYKLGQRGRKCTVVEADGIVGGISRTPLIDGWRFDIGGHRFFTKVHEVEALWHEILGSEDFLRRPRMSRIFYDGKFFDYPIQPLNALKKLGVLEAFRCLFSFIWVRIRKPANLDTFEGFTASRFGWRLYRIFFKTYTEKVWGVSATDIKADWGAQRIKDLDLVNAVLTALKPKRIKSRRVITSLIEEFSYPKYGPGMMWEKCAELVGKQGNQVLMNEKVVRLTRSNRKITSVTTDCEGREHTYQPEYVVSSMPISELVKSMDPPAPLEVLEAADSLRYRDHITVALVVPQIDAFPDNWIYVHSPEVKLGRIQNFGAWSPYMVKDGRTCLGLEYFVFEGDDFWMAPDEELIEIGKREIGKIGIVDPARVQIGYVARTPKAYPMYDDGYADKVNTIRKWLEDEAPNVFPVGRNGMHRYNNQDHSMYTAMLTVENILGASHDIWSVNVEAEYHEVKKADAP